MSAPKHSFLWPMRPFYPISGLRLASEWPSLHNALWGQNRPSAIGEQTVSSSADHDITGLLERLREGDVSVRDEVYRRIYQELQRMASGFMRGQPSDHTLEPSALVHEAYLKLVDRQTGAFEDRNHFLATAARAMRWVLVDHARGKGRKKRSGDRKKVPLEEVTIGYEDRTVDVLTLNDALTKLGEFDEDATRIVELRFFAGLTVKDTAQVLGRSVRQVERDWQAARAWLHGEMG